MKKTPRDAEEDGDAQKEREATNAEETEEDTGREDGPSMPEDADTSLEESERCTEKERSESHHNVKP